MHMKPMKRLILPLLLAATIAPASAAPAMDIRQKMAIANEIAEFREELNITDGQREGARDILSEYKLEIQAQFAAGKAARKTMEKAVKEHGPESAQATQAATAIGRVATSRALLTAEIMTDLKTVLTDEQIAMLQDLREKILLVIENAIGAHQI